VVGLLLLEPDRLRERLRRRWRRCRRGGRVRAGRLRRACASAAVGATARSWRRCRRATAASGSSSGSSRTPPRGRDARLDVDLRLSTSSSRGSASTTWRRAGGRARGAPAAALDRGWRRRPRPATPRERARRGVRRPGRGPGRPGRPRRGASAPLGGHAAAHRASVGVGRERGNSRPSSRLTLPERPLLCFLARSVWGAGTPVTARFFVPRRSSNPPVDTARRPAARWCAERRAAWKLHETPSSRT
jgi:hypothetical protein